LIDKFFANPESMLVGDNRVLSILFSDIRSFTTISEAMAPDDW
jgi:class 3 adenylate cyclase